MALMRKVHIPAPLSVSTPREPYARPTSHILIVNVQKLYIHFKSYCDKTDAKEFIYVTYRIKSLNQVC